MHSNAPPNADATWRSHGSSRDSFEAIFHYPIQFGFIDGSIAGISDACCTGLHLALGQFESLDTRSNIFDILLVQPAGLGNDDVDRIEGLQHDVIQRDDVDTSFQVIRWQLL